MAEEKITQPQTMYSSLSDSDLYAMYRHDSWATLDESQRHDLLQETVNREAIADGMSLLTTCRLTQMAISRMVILCSTTTKQFWTSKKR